LDPPTLVTFATSARGFLNAPKQKAERMPSSIIIGAVADDAAGTEDL